MLAGTRDDLEDMISAVSRVWMKIARHKGFPCHLQTHSGNFDSFDFGQTVQINHPRNRVLVISRAKDLVGCFRSNQTESSLTLLNFTFNFIDQIF